MRWKRGAGDGQIEDRRTGGMRGLPMAAGGGGIGLILFLLVTLLGGGNSGFDPGAALNQFPAAETGAVPGLNTGPDPDADQVEFVKFVVSNVQESWQKEFERAGQTYTPTVLVLFDQPTETGCGTGTSETGPFYCPLDQKVYVDLSFFRELAKRFEAPGDFAQAYVIAHEFGHHVQNLLGIDDNVRKEQQRDRQKANELSVKLELQADCLAGIWAHSALKDEILDPGDLQEGLDAAAAVGDDRIQKQAGSRVEPHTWTHGSYQQRMSWFSRGYDSGLVENCDTFA